MIREQLKVKKGTISLNEGISSINNYMTLKKDNNSEAMDFIDNSFSCPIIFKNFDEDIIPENKTLLIEIKSGFDIIGVKEQIIKRIDIINECFFQEGEKPTFFIGLINLDSNKIKDLSKYKDTEFKFNDNTLIICCIDYEYCRMDLSYQVKNDYLLHKGLKNLELKVDGTKKDLEKKIDGTKKDLEKKIEVLDAKIDDTKKDLESKIDVLDAKIDALETKIDFIIDAIKNINPGIRQQYQEIYIKKNKEEEKKNEH